MSVPRYENRRDEKRMRARVRGKVVHVDFGSLQILDHSETTNLSLLLRDSPKDFAVRVDVLSVMFLPSGFFGALLDGVESGRRMLLVNATPHVKALIGYQKFVTRGVVHL